MGIRLVIEVLDCYHGPDARKLWLLAWAEKANDGTRAGWPTREVLAHRTGRSLARTSNIATELCAEGVLKRDGGGNRSGPARFVLLPLTEAGKGSARANSSGDVKGAPEPNPSSERKGSARANPKPPVKGSESAIKGSESAIKGSDPTLWPAETGSLPLSTTPSEEQPSEPLVAADAPTAQTILANFIDWVRAQGGDLTHRTTGQLAKQIGDLLEQDVSDRYIRKGLADWYASGHNPATFDSYANAAINAAARNRAAQNGGKHAKAPGPERARGWFAAGQEYEAQAEQGRREITQ
jgi:hypothetical protein